MFGFRKTGAAIPRHYGASGINMILSYHPIYEGDENRTCAGRQPDGKDLAAIQKADAVILNQGCYQSLYEMAKNNCRYVFPNYDAKFQYPGKSGQILLFRETNSPHPRTQVYVSLSVLGSTREIRIQNLPFKFPFVFKFNWGGEGETVYLIQSMTECKALFEKVQKFERSGHKGFLLQEYVPNQNRCLRVVVIGNTFIPYWRVKENAENFHSNLNSGGVIDRDADPELQEMAVSATKAFCCQTGINLAGFDFLFNIKNPQPSPLFLEINYFFGRRGIGGSEKYYDILKKEIDLWVRSLSIL